MAAHVYQCSTCGELREGGSYYSKTAPRTPWGTIDPRYRDRPDTPVFCSLECQDLEGR